MSENTPEGKRTARERLAAERERNKAREKRRRTTIVGGAVICVLGLAAVIGVIAANAGHDKSDDSAGPVVTPKGATGKNGLAVPVGKPEAKSTLTVWEDFRCPACKQFEDGFRPTVHELTASGKLKAEYHLVTLIDKNLGGSGSKKAANAAVCAQDAGKYAEYHDTLYKNQPRETDDTYGSNAKLIELAAKVPGLDTPAFRKCVEDGRHNSWVGKSHKAFEDGGFQGTPTVLLNGKNIYADQNNPLTPDKLKKMVEDADKS